MELLVSTLAALLLVMAAVSNSTRPARHRAGSTVAEIQARLASESRTYLPRRGW
ncbi:hypothetical protein HLB23_22260 [Nocardia uniformis]|uniref:Uncharacterized protein n=1 Tax=Nocardia uniformis TaxID=53432 RepID=A0A849CC62_9NOCA|nr:hypothetical protein [Nocardia uniformis]NNH72549.1 hypothetical protein [Nocardia uniformis]